MISAVRESGTPFVHVVIPRKDLALLCEPLGKSPDAVAYFASIGGDTWLVSHNSQTMRAFRLGSFQVAATTFRAFKALFMMPLYDFAELHLQLPLREFALDHWTVGDVYCPARHEVMVPSGDGPDASIEPEPLCAVYGGKNSRRGDLLDLGPPEELTPEWNKWSVVPNSLSRLSLSGGINATYLRTVLGGMEGDVYLFEDPDGQRMVALSKPVASPFLADQFALFAVQQATLPGTVSAVEEVADDKGLVGEGDEKPKRRSRKKRSETVNLTVETSGVYD